MRKAKALGTTGGWQVNERVLAQDEILNYVPSGRRGKLLYGQVGLSQGILSKAPIRYLRKGEATCVGGQLSGE